MHTTRRVVTGSIALLSVISIGIAFSAGRSKEPELRIVVSQGETRAPQLREPHVVVNSTSVTQVVFEVRVDEIELVRNAESGDRICIPGTAEYDQPGAIAVPVIRRIFALPECDNVEVVAFERKAMKVREVTLARVPSLNSPATSGEHETPYGTARLAYLGTMRGQRLAIVDVFPVVYDAVDQEARIITEMSVTLRPVRPIGEAIAPTALMENLFRGVVANYPGYGATNPPRDPRTASGPGDVCWCDGATIPNLAADVNACAPDYLIIVAEELVATQAQRDIVDSLAQHRAQYNGFNVAIVSMEDVDNDPDPTTTPALIDSLIELIYDAESAGHLADGKLGYVLLLGDGRNSDGDWLLPGTYFGDPEGDIPLENGTDIVYSLMDGAGDVLPDLFIGRLPVDADSLNWELTNVRNKIVGYEPLPANEAWVDEMVLISGGDLLDIFDPESLFNEIDDEIASPTKTIRKLHRLDSQWGLNTQFSRAAADSLIDGAWFALTYGHSYYNYLGGVGSQGCFLPSDYDTLNTTRPSVLFAMGSYLGWYENDEACSVSSSIIDACDVLCERFVVQPGGAVATIGYCRSTEAGMGGRDVRAYMHSLFRLNSGSLGECVVGAKLVGMNQFGPTNPITLRLNLFGDPALNVLWRDVPHDTVDLSISALGIAGVQAGCCAISGVGNQVEARISNEAANDAWSFGLDGWIGHPDSSSSVHLGSLTVPHVRALGDTNVALPWSLENGAQDIYVVLDVDEELAEPTRENNIAHRVIYAAAGEYLEGDGFSLSLLGADPQSRVIGTVLIENVHPSSGSEIIACHRDSLVCLSGNGALIWEFSRSAGTNNVAAIADVYKDGRMCIVYETGPLFGFPTPQDHIYVLDGSTGVVLDSIPVPVTATHYVQQSCFAADLHAGDSTLEVLHVFEGQLTAYDLNGDELWGKELDSTVLGPSSVALADLDNDGGVDVLFARGDSLVALVGRTGADIWRIETASDFVSDRARAITLADVDGDGALDIITEIVNGASAKVVVLNADGSVVNDYDVGVGESHSFAAADLDSDGDIEVVVASASEVRVFDAALNLLNEMDVETVDQPPLLLADSDGDGDAEILVLESVSFHVDVGGTFFIYAFALLSQDLAQAQRFVVVYQSFLDPPKWSQMAIADTNLDGILDLVVTVDDRVYSGSIGTSVGRIPWSHVNRNPMHTRLMEQPLSGTYSSAVSLFNDCRVVDDVVFGDSLYVDRSAVVRVNSSSLTSGGQYSSLCEISMEDRVDIVGVADQPVRIESASVSAGPGSWGSIVLESSNEGASITHCVIEHATYGLSTERDASIDNAVFRNCGVGMTTANGTVALDSTLFQDNSAAGLLVFSGTLEMGGCSLIENGVNACVYVYSTATLDADGSVFTDNAMAVSNAGTANLANATFTDNTVAVSNAGDLTMTGSTVSGAGVSSGDTGVIIDGASAWASIMGSDFDDLDVAIHFDQANGGDGVRNNTYSGGGIGILVESGSAEIRHAGNITGNDIGVQCIAGAYAVVESTEVQLNGIGVQVKDSSDADLGHASGGQSVGYNKIHHNSSYHVDNQNASVTVMAENISWRAQAPPASKFQGNVDRDPYLTTEPDLDPVSPLIPQTGTPTAFHMAGPVPNPFNPSTTITYEVPEPGSEVRMRIYDVRGRLVRDLVSEFKRPGHHSVVWDGVDRHGNGVASGIYFVQMKATGYTMSRKLVLLK